MIRLKAALLFRCPNPAVLSLKDRRRSRFTTTKASETCVNGEFSQIAEELQQRVVVRCDNWNALCVLRRPIEEDSKQTRGSMTDAKALIENGLLRLNRRRENQLGSLIANRMNEFFSTCRTLRNGVEPGLKVGFDGVRRTKAMLIK